MLIQRIKNIRLKYYPEWQEYGFCSDIADVVALHLKEEYAINFIFGKVNGIHHIWLEIDGVQIDPSRDCALFSGDVFVAPVTTEYVFDQREPITTMLKGYYKDLTLEQCLAKLGLA